MASTLGAHNPLRYRGYVYDNWYGVYYLQSRYYIPRDCRFLNADVFTSTGQGLLGNNMFAHCNNNPVNYSDPAGLCALHMTNILDNRFSNITMCGCSGGSGSSYYQESASGGVINDTLEFIFNTDEHAVLDAEHFAFYKGVPVVKLPIEDNAFSVGFAIIMGNDVQNAQTVRHEYGHSAHSAFIGMKKYMQYAFVPSLIGYWSGVKYEKYFSQPWEYTAEALGRVIRDEGKIIILLAQNCSSIFIL